MSTDPDSTDGREPAVRVRGLTKRFGSVLALDGLDLDVPAGSIFGLLGPNGAGKTTAIRILTGLARATAGHASIGGAEVGLDRPEIPRPNGYPHQDPPVFGRVGGRGLPSPRRPPRRGGGPPPSGPP